jgi:hypothetical protein
MREHKQLSRPTEPLLLLLSLAFIALFISGISPHDRHLLLLDRGRGQ